MNAYPCRTTGRQRGFSTAELLVAVAIGLLLMSGVLGLFVTNKSVFTNTTHATELQENGRFALDYLLQDLRHAYFFGEKQYDGFKYDPNAWPKNADVTNNCGEEDSKQNDVLNFNDDSEAPSFPLLGTTATSVDPIGCISNALHVAGIPSDILLTKSARPHPLYSTADLTYGKVYIASNRLDGSLRLFTADTDMPNISSACTDQSNCYPYGAYWPYQFSAYYIRAGNTPTLARMVLEWDATDGMTVVSEDLADGVEGMRLLYGVSADGTPPTYVSANTVSNWNDVVSVQVHLLLRTTQPDRSYQDALSYQMGDLTVTATQGTAVSQGAQLRNFRRSVISSTVMLRNKPLMDN